MSKAFTAESKPEAAKRVPDQHYTHGEAAKAMNVSLSAVNRWVKSLRREHQGKTSPGLPLTSEHTELREMRKRIQYLEIENEILKKATALLIFPLGFFLSPGQSAEIRYATSALTMARIPTSSGRYRTRPAHLAADKAYSGRAFRAELRRRRIKAVIPQRSDQQR